MFKRLIRIFTLPVLAIIFGCGGEDAGPTQPSPPANPMVVSASKDNTLYEDTNGMVSNGELWRGRLGLSSHGEFRRDRAWRARRGNARHGKVWQNMAGGSWRGEVRRGAARHGSAYLGRQGKKNNYF